MGLQRQYFRYNSVIWKPGLENQTFDEPSNKWSYTSGISLNPKTMLIFTSNSEMGKGNYCCMVR